MRWLPRRSLRRREKSHPRGGRRCRLRRSRRSRSAPLYRARSSQRTHPRFERSRDARARKRRRPEPDADLQGPRRTDPTKERHTDPGVGPTLASGTEEMPAAPIAPEPAPAPAPAIVEAPVRAAEPVAAPPRVIKLPTIKKRWLWLGGGGVAAAQ